MFDPSSTDPADTTGRRARVLEAAMGTFTRYGYRKTSMDLVAEDASISRQGLYFLFASKAELFAEAVEHTVRTDLAAAARAVEEDGVPLDERLVRAFDHWAGRHVGPMSRDVLAVVGDHPDLVGPWVASAPEEFARIVVSALGTEVGDSAAARIAPVLLSASIGIKHQVDERGEYLSRVRHAIDVLLDAAPPRR